MENYYIHEDYDKYIMNLQSPIYWLRSYDPTPFPGEVFVKLEYPYVDKDILPYYSISNYGRVYSSYNNIILKLSLDSKGYPIIVLGRTDHKTRNAYRIHRLLMLIFNYQEGCEDLVIHHKDFNKYNFRMENLEWCTMSYNMQEAVRLNEITYHLGEERPNTIFTNDQVREICERIARGDIITQIADDYGVHMSTIYNISCRRNWRSISKDYDFSNKNKTTKRKKVK